MKGTIHASNYGRKSQTKPLLIMGFIGELVIANAVKLKRN